METDLYDQELLESFKHLGPLLQAASQYKRESAEEPHSKRPKQEAPAGADTPNPRQQTQTAMMNMMKLMAALVLQHEKNLQLLSRQDSFVFYAQVNPQGAVPLLADLATEWKTLHKQNPEAQILPTMRTYLLRGMVKEVHLRVKKMSSSRQGEDLWDKAVSTGVLQKDGSWTYQRWSHEEKRLIPAGKTPLAMTRVLHQFQHLEELLEDSSHVVRFHALKAQPTVIPWFLQICMRQNEAWHILMELQQLGLWSLLGLSLRVHTQTQSKQASLLHQCLQQANGNAKGKGKGKNTGKHHHR